MHPEEEVKDCESETVLEQGEAPATECDDCAGSDSDTADGTAVHEQDSLLSRRAFLMGAVGSGLAISALTAELGEAAELVNTEPKAFEAIDSSQHVDVWLKVNGERKRVKVDPRSSLLDTLRESLGLTGSKKGCDFGQCGACTVLVDGKRIYSCMTLALMYQNKEITTIEGLSKGDNLNSLRSAFVSNDGFQCGFCTSGQICSAFGMLKEWNNGDASYVTEEISQVKKKTKITEEEIRERMSGNLCRCGAYPGIVAAIKEASNA